ncbi:BREX system serine/threonine kinase PglW [Streptomyces mayteni]
MTPTGSSSSPRPKPGPSQVKRWYQTRPSPYAWEQSALDHIRRRMPNSAPHYAWATFSFTAASGRVNECDVLIATPRGLYLVEVKSHPGQLTNSGDTWSFRASDGRVRTIRNPLHLTDIKSKDLKDRLRWAVSEMRLPVSIPRIEPVVFLSDAQLSSELDAVQRTRVFGRDGAPTGLPGIWDDFLGQPPERESQRVTEQFTRHLPQLMQRIGVSASTKHLIFGDEWKLSPRPLDAGPTWEDRLAERRTPIHEEGRVRLYLVEQQATDEQRRSTTRAAQREYQMLQGIAHPGIAQAVDFRQHDAGPAILFRHRAADLRLDNYLAVHGPRLSETARRGMVRQLADAVRYAHRRSLYHRALASRSVYVTARENGADPVLRITDWQAAARDFDTASLRSLGNTILTQRHLEDGSLAYLAPEAESEHPDPVVMDIFGLGAVAYHVLTGLPPADSRAALKQRLQADGGLHLYAVSDSLDADLDELIYAATRTSADDRLQSADAFLDRLDEVERETARRAHAVEADPLTATAGQAIEGGWTIERVLGAGSTARALFVSRVTEDQYGGEQRQERVLKVARDAQKNDRLEAEAKALQEVGGDRIVKLLDPPHPVAGRIVIAVSFAGHQTLAQRLRDKGRLGWRELSTFGEDLFRAVEVLAGSGVRHRDLKPDNLGIITRPGDGQAQLMLFDFSLADVRDGDIKAGTRGYLDPFLGQPRRPTYDDHAECYAAAVVLHEMASGERPVWGDGATDPLSGLDDEHPQLSRDLFEPALAAGLEAFFQRALHRDAHRRHESWRQMRDHWRAIFSDAQGPRPDDAAESDSEAPRDQCAERAQLDTLLEEAGLTPTAVAVADEYGASIVQEFLGIPRHRLRNQRGVGKNVQLELSRRHRQWTTALRTRKATPPASATGAPPAPEQADARLSIEHLAELLNPVPPGRRDNKRPLVIAAMLGLPAPEGAPAEVNDLGPWPTGREVAAALGLSVTTVSGHLTSATKEWAAMEWLTQVREEIVEIVGARGRVATVEEAARELRARHGASEPTAARTFALVRAALAAETHVTKGKGTDSGPEHEPRFGALRRRGRVLIALHSLPGSEAPTAEEYAAYVMDLGEKADELAAADPLLDSASVFRQLRNVAGPPGMEPLPDPRILTLAALASTTAAASPKQELYPKALPLSRALQLSQAAAGVRRDVGISLDGLLARVRSRFPELTLGTPTYVEVEEALKEAGFPFAYQADRFRPPAPPEPPATSRFRTSTSSSIAAAGTLAAAAAAGRDPEALLRAKLTSALDRGGFLALNVHVRRLPGAAKLISEAFPVAPVNLSRLFLTEFRALAAAHHTDWSQVLAADTRYSRTQELPGGLRSYVSRVWQRVADRLDEIAARDARAVLFVHTAGLLAHYYPAGGHDLLVALQRAARRPGATPHGLWLLTPTSSSYATPEIDGRIVEITGGDAERAVLTENFLTELRNAPAVVAAT